ncbi:MAG: hypothetical protein O3A00_20125 [Planctomycetota bacterium]|nr:hypothetical protein [Planctomycetota bacterium]
MKTNYKTSKRTAFIATLCLLTITGCGKRRDMAETNTFDRNNHQHVVMIVMDLSGSFAEKMANDGKAYEFATACVDHYFRKSDPLNDRIILAQISGTERSLLWEGTPIQLRKDFPSADSFRNFLLTKADGGGSLVNRGVTNAIDYLNYHPRYGGGDAKTVTLILSDMDDTGSSDSERGMNESLAAYARIDGSIGIYFCNQLLVESWKDRLSRAGVQNCIVESEIVGKPELPKFE